jgi:F0F1-type ATP synthase assembly protein I
MSNASTQPPKEPLWRAFSASAVGIEMGVCVLVGWLLGYWTDGQLGTDPWLMLAGVLVGVVAGFRALVRTSQIAWRRSSPEEM